jgi:translation initiation factor IF-3
MTTYQDQRREEKKKAQPKTKLHDIKFHMRIAEHDKQMKLKQAFKFLEKRDQVRITVQLMGREQSRPDSGVKFLQDLVDQLAEVGAPSVQRPTSPPNISYTLNPLRARS